MAILSSQSIDQHQYAGARSNVRDVLSQDPRDARHQGELSPARIHHLVEKLDGNFDWIAC